jgi:hypothetical protein
MLKPYRMLFLFTLLAAQLFLAAGAAKAGSATVAPDWNRRVRSLTITPPSAGSPMWTLSCSTSVAGFSGVAVGQNLSTRVRFLVNHNEVGGQTFSIIGGGVGNCCDVACPDPGYCDNSEFGCWCGVVVTPKYTSTLRPGLITPTGTVKVAANINPGDLVTVEAVADGGGAAEQYTADDQISQVVGIPTPASGSSWGRLKNLFRAWSLYR